MADMSAIMQTMMQEGTWAYIGTASFISLFTSAVIVFIVWMKFKKSIIWKLNLYGNVLIFLSFTGMRIGKMFSSNNMGWVLLTTYLLIAGLVIYFSKSFIARPIIKLKESADKVTSGEFDIELPRVKEKNEIKDLTASLEMLIYAFKAKLEFEKNYIKKGKK